ncbi:MAG: hydantoinase B/oxoprolinase family protein [Polyangiales bacterium]
MISKRWKFLIDRGGTFTDLVGVRPDQTIVTTKLLSENPEQYQDAAVAGMRRLLGLAPGERIPSDRVEVVKMGTTVATNALLERAGEPCVLVTTRGFRDQLRIGYQNRPRLFERQIRLPELIFERVIEVDERITARGEVLRELDEREVEAALQQAHAEGLRSLAIVFMHAWRHSEHEARVARLARRIGFTQVSASHVVSPLVKFVSRGDTTTLDAYLSPILRRYVTQVESQLERHVPLLFMKSDGGLTDAADFQGKDAILSGPAGGIVGMVRSALAADFRDLITFDMGGTSTDVAHFSGRGMADVEREFDTLVAGVRIRAPMMSIHTIAAGGGSLLRFDGQKFRVGPASAGANPGPAAYRRGGPLTLTDCQVLLGRIQPAFFPRLFGPTGDQALDHAAVSSRFDTLAAEVTRATSRSISAEEVAEGFLRVAISNMSNAIQFVSVQRGHDVTDYTLACFGGAGGQHACLVADELGMSTVFIHGLSGVMSAFGMGLADLTAMRSVAFEQPLEQAALRAAAQVADELGHAALAEVSRPDVARARIPLVQRAQFSYQGTHTTRVFPLVDEAEMRRAFEAAYSKRFSVLMPERPLIIEALSVEAVGKTLELDLVAAPAAASAGTAETHARMFAGGRWHEAGVYRRSSLALGQLIVGPAIVAEDNATIVVDPGWRLEVTAQNHLVLHRYLPRAAMHAAGTEVDPVRLEVFNNLFMSIAEQMGARLQNTATSTNIKERLDYSCALFDAAGDLIANAPHMPVHLGSMGESIKTVIRNNQGAMAQGDVFLLNSPFHGGTHLPDATVVMPVFSSTGEEILFYVAARGHHADIGGITPGSMPPASSNVEEEGVLIDNFKLVSAGRMREDALRALLREARHPARNPEQNLADLRAQVAACEKGRAELLGMVEHYGLPTVQAYMGHVQDNAEECVRRAIASLRDGRFEYAMDNGAKVCVQVTVDHATRSAVVDFSGTTAQLAGNFNAPPAVTNAAVLYVFRTLVSDEIPMNAGCLKPVRVVIPEGSMLAPRYPAATVAGNVETSQCVVDALYGALGTMGAAAGTMSNLTFGNERYQYYETIAGGSGAGEGFDGTPAVQTHMTNSRMTDPEVLEMRYPVLVEEHSSRTGSGGAGRFRGGDGALRKLRMLEPMTAALLANRHRVPPYGMAGGEPGSCGAAWLEREGAGQRILGSCSQVEMLAGDVLVVATPSGGGYGVPD